MKPEDVRALQHLRLRRRAEKSLLEHTAIATVGLLLGVGLGLLLYTFT